MNMGTIYPRYHPLWRLDQFLFCFFTLVVSCTALFVSPSLKGRQCTRAWFMPTKAEEKLSKRRKGGRKSEKVSNFALLLRRIPWISEIYPADSWSSTTTSEARIFPPTILRVAVFFRWFSKKDIAELRRNHVLQRTGTEMKMDGWCFKMHSWESGKRLQYFVGLKYTPWN